MDAIKRLGAALLLGLLLASGAQAQPLSALPNATTPLTGSELTYLIQNGVPSQSTVAAFGIAGATSSFASPPPLGSTTPNTGAFTTLTATGGTLTGLTISSSSISAAEINSGLLSPTYGGTGVNNGVRTITLGGNLQTAGSLTTSGAFSISLTAAGVTAVTLPTSGTLVSSTTIGSFGYATVASPTFTGTVTIPGGASISGFATLASPAFSGTPSLPTGTTGVTQTAGNATTALATTAFVSNSFAPLASPTFTGTVTLPTGTIGTTQTAGNSTTALATTAFVATSFAPLASPSFSGTPTMPSGTLATTQAPGTSNASLATTSFVATSFAPLASPALTGTPTVPTAAAGTSTTQAASTAYAQNAFASPPAIGATTPASGKFTTLQASSTITPSTTNGIVGTTLGDNANAGSVGEYINSTIAVGSAVSLTSNIAVNVTSITLTAGDWNVWGTVATNPGASTVQANVAGSISTTSATFPTAPDAGAYMQAPFTAATGTGVILPVGMRTFDVTTSTTIYLVGLSGFSASTNAMYGFLGARRVR